TLTAPSSRRRTRASFSTWRSTRRAGGAMRTTTSGRTSSRGSTARARRAPRMAADFPVAVAVQGDYETRLMMVEPETTMDELCAAVAPFVVGRFVPEHPDKHYRIHHQNCLELIPLEQCVWH